MVQELETRLSETESPIIILDGVVYDMATGEILGVAPEEDDGQRAGIFQVDSLDAAEWVLEKLGNREAAVIALEQRKRAIIDNLDVLIGQESRAIGGLHRRFDADLESFAREVLGAQGWKSKTLRTPYGSVSFRDVRGSHKILDQIAAVAWAKDVCPEIVRVAELVTVTDVLPQLDDGESPPWLETTPGEERAYIRTGVKS